MATGLFTGIDIQERAAHAAQVRVTASGVEPVVFRSMDLPSSDQELLRTDALRELLKRFRGSHIAVVMPDRDALFHNMLLPTADRAELSGMAAFAMEQQAPGAAALLTTHHVLDANQPGGTRAALIAADADAVKTLCEPLKRCNMPPRAVIPGCVATARWFSSSVPDGGALVSIHFQSRGAAVCIVTAAGPVMQRYVPLHGADIPARLEALISGVRLAAGAADTPAPGRIIISGACSDDDRGGLERAFGIPVSISTGAEMWPQQPVGAALRAAGAAMELAASGNACPNLLPPENNRRVQGAGARWLAAAAAGIFIAITAMGAWTSVNAQRVKTLELRRLDTRIDELRPRIKDIQKKKKLAAAYSRLEPRSPQCLDVLKEISIVLPDRDIYVTGLGCERGGRLTLTAETTDANTAPRAIAALNRSSLFSEVTLGYAHKKDRDENIVEFEARARIGEDTP